MLTVVTADLSCRTYPTCDDMVVAMPLPGPLLVTYDDGGRLVSYPCEDWTAALRVGICREVTPDLEALQRGG